MTEPVKIVVGSTNPVKGRAALEAFQSMFPEQSFELQQIAVPSGVSVQPVGQEETLRGAQNRALAAQQALPEADYWVGLEGGVQEMGDDLMAIAWMVVRSRTRVGQSCTAGFYVPPEVARLVRAGMEVGEADDLVFHMNDSKRNSGASGILTHGVIDRAGLYGHALILALIPFKNEDLYA